MFNSKSTPTLLGIVLTMLFINVPDSETKEYYVNDQLSKFPYTQAISLSNMSFDQRIMPNFMLLESGTDTEFPNVAWPATFPYFYPYTVRYDEIFHHKLST